MSKRSFPSQAEIERAIRAAQKQKATVVCIRLDGSVIIDLSGEIRSELIDRRAIEDEILAKLP